MRFNFKGGLHDTNSKILYNLKKFKNWNLPFIQLKLIFKWTFCLGVSKFAYTIVSASGVSGTTLTFYFNKKQMLNVF